MDGQLALIINGKRVASRREEGTFEFVRLNDRIANLRKFYARLAAAGLGQTYEAAHARLAVECHATAYRRLQLLADRRTETTTGTFAVRR